MLQAYYKPSQKVHRIYMKPGNYYRSYLLRIWLEESEAQMGNSQNAGVRISLEDSRTGTKIGFSD
ncbi:MAG: hypothetical protein D6706_14330, partial [Chloroflexi bacterium]